MSMMCDIITYRDGKNLLDTDQNLASWYRRVMGMLMREDEEKGSWTAGYSDPGVTLVFKVLYTLNP